jgi:hypothetical protein
MGQGFLPDLIQILGEGFHGELFAAGPAAQLNAASGRLQKQGPAAIRADDVECIHNIIPKD